MNNTKKILLVIVLILAFFLRTILLDRIPTGISNDELHFVLNAKSVFLSFSDMSGKWFPLSLKTIPQESSSELPFVLITPIIGPLPTNLFTARLPFAIIGTLIILIIFNITYKLTNNYYLSLISAIVAALNPWSIYVSRTSFDAPLSLLFYSIAVLLIISQKPKLIYLASLFSAIGFYCYIGNKILLIPITLIVSIFAYKFQKQNLKPLIIINIIAIAVTTFFYATSVASQSSSRTSELWTPWSPQITNQVKLEKDQSLRNPLKPLITNNFTIYSRNFLDKYLNSFSTSVFFVRGDDTFMVSLWKHGYFYYIDFPLLIIGLIFLSKKYPKLLFLLLALIAISPIPEAIRSDKIPAFAFHSSFQYPFLYIIIAAGLYNIFTNKKSKYLSAITIAIYVFSFINFSDIYFLKYPVYQPEGFSFSRRILAKYIAFESPQRPVYVLTSEPNTYFRSYLFYTNRYNRRSINTIQQIYSQSRDNISFDNIKFINNLDLLPPDQLQYTLVVDPNTTYPDQEGTKYSISRLSDAGEIFKIYRGSTCSQQKLDFFSHNLSFVDLKIEQMDESTFCNKYITRTF